MLAYAGRGPHLTCGSRRAHVGMYVPGGEKITESGEPGPSYRREMIRRRRTVGEPAISETEKHGRAAD